MPKKPLVLPEDKAKALEVVKQAMRLGLIRMNRVQNKFIRIKNASGRTPKRRLLETGEKTGKTFISIAESLAHAMGYRPWLETGDPDYKISVRVPNQGLVACMTMAQSVTAKIEPTLESLIPDHCAAVWKRDTTGALKSVMLKFDYLGNPCGSTMHIRSYNQEAKTFLGIDYDWAAWDEPPPKEILIATERGKVVSNAPSWFAMTPLSEPYIFDMFSVKAFNNTGTDQEISAQKGSMWDNCQDYCRRCDCYIPQNDPANMKNPLEERPVDLCPKCGEIMGFIPRAGILEYCKLFDSEEMAVHIEGKWAHLSGLVYKEIDRAVHIYPDFEIPRNWMRIEVVDPHDARPTRWLFIAVSPDEITVNGKSANRAYVYTYLLANGNVEDIVRQVRVKRAEHNYIEPEMVILDAKFGSKTVKTMMDVTSWEEELDRAGIKKIILSHSDPGDIALGHKRVKEYLKPHFSKTRNLAFPGLLFAEDGCRGDRGPIQDMFNYQWKQGTDKPEEAYKDFCDCVRYFALEQPVYRQPNVDLNFLTSKKEERYTPLTYGLSIAR